MSQTSPSTPPPKAGNPAYPHRNERERLVEEAESHRDEENVPPRPAKEIKKAEENPAPAPPGKSPA